MKAQPSILLVDDDPEDRDIIKDTFDDMGYDSSLRFEENGEEAIRFLQEADHLPSLIILDLNMPRMNGRQTLAYLKSSPDFSSIPVIIFSTSLNQFEHDQCLALGAHSYVIKPVSYQEAKETAAYFQKVCDEVAS